MSKPHGNTSFDKGARLLTAMIEEVDLSDELKETAQALIRGLAAFMPHLLAATAATAAPTDPQTDDAIDPKNDAKWFQYNVDAARRTSSAKPAPAAQRRRQHARPGTGDAPAQLPTVGSLGVQHEAEPHAKPPHDSAPEQAPPPVIPQASETDPQQLLRAYHQVLSVQHGHLDQLSAAFMRALERRGDPARVIELLNTVSTGSTWLWRAALDDLAQA